MPACARLEGWPLARSRLWPSFETRAPQSSLRRLRKLVCARAPEDEVDLRMELKTRAPHAEERRSAIHRAQAFQLRALRRVSKHGRSLDLACGRPSRRAQARSSGRGSELAATATAISGRRYSVAECCDFALLQLDTAEQIFLANEARLMHKRASFRTVIKARCGLLRRAFVLGV
jgi:hypothetical protein